MPERPRDAPSYVATEPPAREPGELLKFLSHPAIFNRSLFPEADPRPTDGQTDDGKGGKDDTAMRSLIISGFALLVLGGFLLLGGLTYVSQEEVVRVGDFEVSASQERSVPTWVGALSLVGGAGLLAAGLLVRRRS